MKCSLDRSRDGKCEEVPFCMGYYEANQIRSNGIGRENQRQFISSVRSHPDCTPLSRIRRSSELYPRSEDQGREARPDRRSSLHIHHAHIEFDERLCGMVEESSGQEAARILAEGRDLAEDPQQGHRHIGGEPRRHHRTVMEGHQGEVRDRRLRHQPRRLSSGPVRSQIRVRGMGYGRDKNRGKLQVEFMVAQLASLGIPIYIKPYPAAPPTRRSSGTASRNWPVCF